ncbi:uncharacterized protein DUF4145 [Nocardia puris]|uniref:Uncharacterized protein DUF4145 n=2 Tax=Nocardia puris TaxID=208602 RepID=A0A366DQ64_9NOCA|nr:uncharacterized protein DUF4145 [Nocardia puris]
MLYGMQQNIRKLAHPIRIGDWPHLVCPVCGVGGLGVGNFAHEHETGVKSHDEDPTDLRGRFSLQLVCGRASCQSWVILTGDYTTDFEPVTDTFIDVWPMLRVRTIYPPIPVMDLPEGLPESVRKAIVRASALIWLDPLAFAAALRSAVECLMDEQGVLVRHTGGRARLHDRLETFRQAQPVAGELLLAVKWVGNTGAHETASFTVDDALEAAEMVEVALGVVYAKDNSALLARAAAINAARRPVPRPTG